MLNKIYIKFFIGLIIPSFFILIACTSRNERVVNSKPPAVIPIIPDKKINKVTFYIENSESMFGYVRGFTEYVDVVSELAEKPEFAEERTSRKFYFINGGQNLQITEIGNDASLLIDKLNIQGYRCGDITKSNLNAMFNIALENAGGDSISILISDAIYDIGQPDAPFNALSTEGRGTRTKFIERLSYGDFQTIIIKLKSQFEGDYFFTSQQGWMFINQTRPFYIWIFGESDLLNKYFPENYINTLKGYDNMARFLKVDKINIPYQATSQNLIGSFKPGNSNPNILNNTEKDKYKKEFQFSIAVDYSTVPFSDSYLDSPENYSCSGDYTVVDIYKPVKKIFTGAAFTTTHLITVFTNQNPYGNLEVTLKNVIPPWITDTNTNNESNIESDTTHTFGFRFLTDAISEAYMYMNNNQNIARFNIEIK